MRSLALLAVTASCGRFAFDPIGDESSGDGGAAELDAPPGALTVSFGETGTADHAGVTRDTFLAGQPLDDLNYGASTELVIDATPVAVVLLRFELSAIPPTAIVFSASLRLRSMSTMGSPLGVYRLREGWDEGTSAAAVGTASWNERKVGLAWTTPGAQPPSRDSAAIATLTLMSGYYHAELDVSTVQAWVSDPASNDGMELYAIGSATIVSRENAQVPERPLLTVTYLP